MNYPWAVPGAKVVCVDDRPVMIEGEYHNIFSRGKTYTIESVQVERLGQVNGRNPRNKVTLSLREVTRWGKAEGFGVCRFRPLITQADDVAKFAWMLTDTKERVDA